MSIDVRSTFALKRKVLNTTASKGVKLELAVAPAAEGKEGGQEGREGAAQRSFVGQGLELVEETSEGRRGVIISSGARSPLETRSPQDLANVGVVLGDVGGDGVLGGVDGCGGDDHKRVHPEVYPCGPRNGHSDK